MVTNTPKFEVQLRGGFSDRNGIKVENCALQSTEFDSRTRTAIINATRVIINALQNSNLSYYQSFLKNTLSEVYSQEVIWSASYDGTYVEEIIYSTIRADNYDSVLTLIEYIARQVLEHCGGMLPDPVCSNVIQIYNRTFEREYVGYRFVGDTITPITDEIEQTAIESALNSEFQEIQQHFKKATGFLADRTTPDYQNSIKESITAIERMCSIILGKSATLGDALKKLEAHGIIIHPALKTAFDKLYGYTSDSSGIRHAGQLGGAGATFDEAKFMLVACSAFVNYLTSLFSKSNLC